MLEERMCVDCLDPDAQTIARFNEDWLEQAKTDPRVSLDDISLQQAQYD